MSVDVKLTLINNHFDAFFICNSKISNKINTNKDLKNKKVIESSKNCKKVEDYSKKKCELNKKTMDKVEESVLEVNHNELSKSESENEIEAISLSVNRVSFH